MITGIPSIFKNSVLQNKEEKKNNVLSLIWLYATWIEAKNISLIKKSRNDFICFENFAKLIDHIDESLEVHPANFYFCQL